MYCTHCGTRNEDAANHCIQCGHSLRQLGTGYPPPTYQPPITPPPQYVQPGSVPNYLAQAILVTLFCCLPFGIVAIVYAAQVNGKLSVGDVQGALHSSSQAKLFAWISFFLGGGIVLIYILIAVITIATGNVH